MALTTKHGNDCTICGIEGKDKETMFLCYQCHNHHCEECSNTHSQENKDHVLIPLTSPVHESNIEVKEDDVLYNMQMDDVKSSSDSPTEETSIVYKQADPSRLKATRCLEFRVERPEDTEVVYVTGLLCVSDYVVVVDRNNYVLKLFDHNGAYLSSTELNDITWGITCVHDSTFATCGDGKTIDLFTVCTRRILREDVSYHVDHMAYGIHYNGTYFCVLDNDNNAITVLDKQGVQVRKITKKEACGKTFLKFGWDIHIDNDTNNIYVPCLHEQGVLCMTIEGADLWFTLLTRPWGITEIRGILCVAYCYGDCLHMLTKDGKYVKKLLNEVDLEGKPEYVYYGQDNKLYVSYNTWTDSRNKISVYTVT